jgi:threonine dehydrogenase-like Zn-dependent dehydrogenase
MRAAVCREPGKVLVEDSPIPVPGEGEVVVKISRCGICGSDLHWYHGIMPVPAD